MREACYGPHRRRTPQMLWPEMLADVRHEHAQAFTQVLRAVALRCTAGGLVGPARVALDGTTLQAVHSTRRHLTPAKRQERRQRLEAHLAPSLPAVDAADAVATDRRASVRAHLA
jgi:hypothetical protein